MKPGNHRKRLSSLLSLLLVLNMALSLFPMTAFASDPETPETTEAVVEPTDSEELSEFPVSEVPEDAESEDAESEDAEPEDAEPEELPEEVGSDAETPEQGEAAPEGTETEEAEETVSSAILDRATVLAGAPDNDEVTINTSAVPTSIKLDTDYNLLTPVTVTPAEIEEDEVLIRIKEVKSNSTSSFDTTGDYDADTHILNARSSDGTQTRAQAEYEVTYEAYIGDEVLATATITITAFDDSKVGEETSGDVAYISKAAIDKVIDGTAEFDADDGPGYDTGEDNGKVRTYDTVSYDFTIENKVYDSADFRAYKKGRVGFEFVLPGTASEIMFNTDEMAWLNSKDGKYTILEVKDGGTTYQVMRGTFLWDSNDPNQPAIGAGQSSFTVSYRVLAMQNGDKIKPYFTFWMDGNDVPQKDVAVTDLKASNYQLVFKNSEPCGDHNRKEAVTLEGHETQVSAYPWLNIRLQSGNTDLARVVKDWDFNTGNDNAPNKGAGTVNGRSVLYGITIMMRRPDGNGLRGVEFPTGPITFDVKLSSSFAVGSDSTDVTEEFAPLLWSVDENRNLSTNYDGRALADIKYAQFTPVNRHSSASTSCWSGGTWSGVQDENGIVHVTVDGYTIKTDWFPWTAVGYADGDTTFYTPSSGKNYWDIGQACFSAGELWYIQPFYSSDDSSYILDYMGAKAGTFETEISDVNMQATGVSGTKVSTQSRDSDDTGVAQIFLERPGEISAHILYAPYQTTSSTVPLTPGASATGEDWATPGTKLSIYSNLFHSAAEGEYRGVAYDQLVKIDDEFMEVEGVRNLTSGYDGNRVNFYYAAKPDGSGWTDDNEMKETVADELDYYSSLADLKNAGKICVGVLMECRGLGTSSRITPAMGIDGVVKDTAEVGKVYMTTLTDRAWRVTNVRKLVEKDLGDTATDEEIDAWVKEKMPSVTHGTLYSAFPNPFRRYEWKNKDGSVYGPGLDYQKATYNESGFVSATAGFRYGDSCLVVGDKAAIQIKALQTTAGGASYSAESTAYYDMDTSQRVADFEIIPSIVASGGSTSGGDVASYKMDVTITVTLPEKLTYITGSAYFGGDYEQPSRHGRQGNITDGVTFNEVDPTAQNALTVSEDGKTLTFVIHDYEVDWNGQSNITLPSIYYSCDIGEAGADNDVENNEQLVTTASIQTTVDHFRPVLEENGNLDDCTLVINKGAVASIVDRASQVAVDVTKGATPDQNTADMSFTMKVVNDAPNDRPDAVVVAHTPYSGDRASSFNGTANVTAFQLDNAPEGMKVYYSTAEEALTKDDYTAEDLADWTELTVGADGKVILPEGENITAIAVNGTIPGNYSMNLSSTIRLTGAKPGDVLSHSFTYNGMYISARSYVVSRAITGVAWKDENHNGIRESGEKRYAGVTVTLLRLKETVTPPLLGAFLKSAIPGDDYEEYQVDGVPVTAVTNANGEYRFEDMPAGTYAVDFEDPKGDAQLSTYLLTAKDEGTNDNIDSDAEEVAENHYRVSGIVMVPTDEITVQRYTKQNNDAGFYRPDLTVTKTVADLTSEEKEADRTFYFQVKLTGAGTDSYVTETVAADGTATGVTVTGTQLAEGYEFSLKDGEQFVIKAIPVGAKYTVSERDYKAFWYLTAKDNESGTLDQDQTAAFTNTFVTPDTVNITAKKTWSGDSDAVRPESVTVQLLKNGTVADTQTLTGNGWSYTWENLPKYDYTWPDSYSAPVSKTENTYSVVETAAAGTTKTTDGKYIVYNTQVSVEGSNPTQYAVEGYYTSDVTNKDGVCTIANTWHPAENEYTGTAGFTVIKVDENGDKITTDSAAFLLEEQGDNNSWTTVDSYETVSGEVTVGGLSEGTYKLTETKAPEGYIKSDTEFVITVSRSGEVLVNVTEDSGTYTNHYEKILVLDSDGDTWSADNQTLTVSNQQITGTIKVTKTVQDTNLAEIATDSEYTFIVYASDDLNTPVDTLTVKAGESAETKKLPYGSYVVKEDAENVPEIEGYDWQTVTTDPSDGQVTIKEDGAVVQVGAVNAYRRIVGKVSVTKTAEDLAGNTINEQQEFTFNIYREGEEDGTPVQTLTVKNGETVTSGELDYGKYVVVEDTDTAGIDGYVFVEDESFDRQEFTIDTYDQTFEVKALNVYNPLVEVSGTKVWDDADDQDGIRPEEITIHLYADGEELTDRTVTVTAEDNWSWSFDGLLKYNGQKEIVYTVLEDEVEGYTAEYDGSNVTNVHIPETTSVKVTKEWEDGNDKDGIRPDEITVRLFADGVDTGKRVVLSKANGYTGEFTDLDKYADGLEIVYTVDEVSVEGYTSSIAGNAKDGFVITNSHTVTPPDEPTPPKDTNPPTPSKHKQPTPTKTPRTGDESNIGLWIAVLVVSSGVAATAVVLTKRKRNK